MHTILVGVDSSARSEDAIAFANRLAAVSSAHVVVACAFPYNDALRQGSNPSYRKALADESEQTACTMRDRMEGIDADRLTIRISANRSPAHALHDLAAAEHAEIIVVGSSRATRPTSSANAVPGST